MRRLMRMRTIQSSCILCASFGLLLGTGIVSAKPKRETQAQPTVSLNATGSKLEREYASFLKSLHAEIANSLPTASERKKAAFQQAIGQVNKAKADADAAQAALGPIKKAKGNIDHAKGKWIGGAEKGIAQAEAALKKAKTAAEREAAEKDVAKWQADKENGLKALKTHQAAYDALRADEPKLTKAVEDAQAALVKAKAVQDEATKAFLADLEPALSSDKLDAKLVKATVLTAATPSGLAQFAQQDAEKEALVSKLLDDGKLMKEMLIAGGAPYGKYGQAMQIYTAIQKASPKASTGNLQRLALATSLEHATPITQKNTGEQASAPATVDPVKRYLHYEKAFLNGELDPAFKTLSAWEYRMVVNSDAPDEILSWGREMLRNYRPDHIYHSDYGWRYVAAVKTEVPYGSQNVKYDRPTLNHYQNIIKNGGICGRRAFFGRFMLRSFGIPTWGVTQKAHAALSHWTPKGWVVNLGAGYQHSWWEKDEVPLTGNQFLLETQARAHAQEDYLKVLRAQWISRILGEEAYNERTKIAGGFWSNVAFHQMTAIASKAVSLGPLGQELAEANEPEQKSESAAVSKDDQKASVKDGVITIPAVAFDKPSGKFSAMKSFSGGMQLHCLGGFKAEYGFDAPQPGKYTLTARVATAQDGQKFLASTGGKPSVESAVPYTIGMWQETEPIEVTLERGKNTLNFELQPGSRGVTIKAFSLKPAR